MKGAVGSRTLSIKSKRDDEYYLVVDNVYTWGAKADGRLKCVIMNKDYDLKGGRGARWTGCDAGRGGRLVYAEAGGDGGARTLEWDGEVDYGFVFTNWILPVVGVLVLVGFCCRACCRNGGGRDRGEGEVVEGLLREQRRLAAVAPGYVEEVDAESQVMATAVVVEPSAPPVAHVMK